MRKGLKKFTVAFEGHYFGGGRVFGQRILFAENAEAARQKLIKHYEKRDDEPIMYVGSAEKWQPGDKNEYEVYSMWGVPGY